MKRPLRELQIPDDLWVPLGELAERLGIDRDVLVRQAVHAFLRFHGALPRGAGHAGQGLARRDRPARARHRPGAGAGHPGRPGRSRR